MKIPVLIVVIVILFSGCASMRKDINSEIMGKTAPEPKKGPDPLMEKKISELEKLNDWFSYPMARSKVQKAGSPIIQPYSREGIYFEVYYDESELKNYAFYDRKLHTDYAWKLNETDNTWEKTGASKPIREGLLYINPAYKTAMYYYPGQGGTFDVFKVRMKYPQ